MTFKGQHLLLTEKTTKFCVEEVLKLAGHKLGDVYWRLIVVIRTWYLVALITSTAWYYA